MDGLISVINELQDTFQQVNVNAKLDLPQIVVVGAQSSGKSSVLENIVGRDFLPRGSGIVTRRPLILQLEQLKKGAEEWGEFLHKPGTKFDDFLEIRKEIERETDSVAGTNKGISNTPINLKIYSPHVLSLTLVDLPGLVRMPVGDQPKEIEKHIKEMILEFIRPPNTIILAVTPGNADIATSDAIKLAQSVDRAGDRTLCVVTKLDIMDRGTDAMDVLDNKVIKLRHGFIGVINRSQQDIKDEVSIRDSLEKEQQFFATHPVYSHSASRLGTPFLSKTLNYLLMNHIREALPDVKLRIDELIKQTKIMLKRYGGDSQHVPPQQQFLQQLRIFCDGVSGMLDGSAHDMPKGELWGGARINYIFYEAFMPHVMNMSPIQDMTDDDIRMVIRNTQGTRPTLFQSDSVFEKLVRSQIKRLEDPSLRCLTFVHDELIKVVEMSAVKLDRHPLLKQRVVDFTKELMLQFRQPTETHIRHMISSELAFINSAHPDLQHAVMHNQQMRDENGEGEAGGARPMHHHGGGRGNPSFTDIPSQIVGAGPASDKEKRDFQELRRLTDTYFSTVKSTMTDHVPKCITFFIIAKMKEELNQELVANLYRQDQLEDLLAESEEVATHRKAANDMMKCLLNAQETLNKVRNFRQ